MTGIGATSSLAREMAKDRIRPFSVTQPWRREWLFLVESRCGAVAVGRTYLLPPLSFGGASLVRPWLRFHIPLIEPDRRISRIRLSDKTSRFRVRRPLQFSEHVAELIGCPISRSFATSCVCLELRSLPSTGITRLPRYYEPLRHPSAPSLSLTGVRLILPDHAMGLPVLRALSLCTCCRHYPGAAAGRSLRSSHPAISAFPGRGAGSACTSTFSRIAQRSLALRPAHSRGHQFVTRYPKASDISLPPCLLRLLPAGAVAGWGLHPLENAALARRTPDGGLSRLHDPL